MTTTAHPPVARRDFVQAGALGIGGLTLSGFCRMAAANVVEGAPLRPTADRCIFVNLAGGPSHLDTFDMKPEGPSENRGEFQSIATNLSGLSVCEHLPQFAKIADQFCLLRGISHTQGDHGQAQSYLGTGNRSIPSVLFPSLGSVTTKELRSRDDLPPYVAIPRTEWNAGYLGDAYAPFQTNEVPVPGKPFSVRGISLADGVTLDAVTRRSRLLARLNGRLRAADSDSTLLDALDRFGRQAHEMMMSAHSQAAFDVSREPDSIRKLFGDDELNQCLLLAMRLIEFGVNFVTVTNIAFGGWDTHTDNFNGHRRLIQPLDHGICALATALREKGLLERTLVVIMGEFGRTPKINQNIGRDHWPRANCALLIGGGVQTGQIIGATDDKGEGPTGEVSMKPDDVAASIYHALGIDPRKEYYTSIGRPMLLVPEGKLIPGLVGGGVS